MEEIDKQIAEEKTDERYVDPEELEQDEPEQEEPAPSPAGQSFKLVPDDGEDEDAA